MKIGAHQSIAGGLYKSIDRGLADECECLQIFVKNANRWQAKPLDEGDADQFQEVAEPFGFENICAHSSYLINLGSTKEETLLKSHIALLDELTRCDRLKVPYHVLHPGAHLGAGEDVAIAQIASYLDRVYLENDVKTMILLETTAGQGSCVGHRLEHMEAIIDKAVCKDNIGICLDTCHMFVAGYDLANDYDTVMDEVMSRFGDKVKVCHLNDAKKPLGAKVDRHELIGDGFIGPDCFVRLVNDKRFDDVLGILETPIGKDSTYINEIAKLKSMREG